MRNKKGQLEIVWTILCIIVVLWFVIGFNMFGIGTAYSKAIGSVVGWFNDVDVKTRTSECQDGLVPSMLLFSEEKITYKSWAEKRTYSEKSESILVVCPENQSNFSCVNWSSRINQKTYLPYILGKYCHRGSNTGENQNNIYCQDINYYYSTQPVDYQGNIGEIAVVNYTLSFEMKPTYTSEEIKSLGFEEWNPANESLENAINLRDTLYKKYNTFDNRNDFRSEDIGDKKFVIISTTISASSGDTHVLYAPYSLVSSECITNE